MQWPSLNPRLINDYSSLLANRSSSWTAPYF